MRLTHQVSTVVFSWVIIAALVYAGMAIFLLSGKLIKIVVNLFI